MRQFVFLGVLPAIALAGRISPPMILRRTDPKEPTTCEEMNLKPCGTGCIDRSYTCCPGQSGGCPADKHCVVDADNKEGCCKNDYVCTGNGGVSYTTFLLTSSAPGSTLLVPEPTTTTTEAGATSSSSVDLPTSTSTEAASTPSTDGAQSSTSTEVSSPSSTTSAGSSTETISTSVSDSHSTSTDMSSSTSIPSTDTTSASTSSSTLSTSNATIPASSSTSSSTTSTAAYSTSTIYTTTTKTITSCPASHPCHHATDSPYHHVTVITETIAVSTTLCPLIESPSLPTPTLSHTLNAQTKVGLEATTITVIEPVVTPDVVCPGEGRVCHVVAQNTASTGSGPVTVVQGTGMGSSSSVRVVVPTTTAKGNGNGTASGTIIPTATKGVVTAGAGRVGVEFGTGSVMAVAVGLLGVAVGQGQF